MASKFTRGLTPSQTVGPFFTTALTASGNNTFVSPVDNEVSGAGQKINLHGRVLDGNRDPVSDALIEIWQADSQGNLTSTDFLGFARSDTSSNSENSYFFNTIKPGAVNESDAPHISVIVTMRGLLTHVYTRLYFSDELEANRQDLVLNQLPENRRATLIAQRTENKFVPSYHFDIHMQGENETIFFDLL